MHALYSSLLPPSAVHHSLFLPHFTPSTIYQLPKPHAALETPEVKVRGNLIVAGGQDLRVFEIREETAAVQDQAPSEEQNGDVDLGDSFFDSAPADVSQARRCIVLQELMSSVRRCASRRPYAFTFLPAILYMASSLASHRCVPSTVVSTDWIVCSCRSRTRR